MFLKIIFLGTRGLLVTGGWGVSSRRRPGFISQHVYNVWSPPHLDIAGKTNIKTILTMSKTILTYSLLEMGANVVAGWKGFWHFYMVITYMVLTALWIYVSISGQPQNKYITLLFQTQMIRTVSLSGAVVTSVQNMETLQTTIYTQGKMVWVLVPSSKLLCNMYIVV